ncbi:MAG TPA: ABC transporter ATP-binding protein [Opitutaceae bacterium]|nr:ABC transporter ATP-binding protein [Opitutaceae bacterium]
MPPLPDAPALSLRGAAKRYGSLTALAGVSLDIAPGEHFGLLGPNGAGKSTLMSLLSGFRAPDSGEVRIGGIPAAEPAARSQLGLVPQGLALYPDLSARENLAVFGALHGLRGRELRERSDELLEAVQLADRARSIVKTFSGGMMRRLNIAAALLHRPRILLCDEPTVGVDPQSRHAIFELLGQLHRSGVTIVYSTHYMEEAARLCSRIAIIDHGRILALGTLKELLERLPFEEEIRFPATGATDRLCGDLGGAGDLATADGLHRFRPAPGFRLSSFFLAAERREVPSRLFEIQRPTLEAVFLHLTGKALRQ